MSSFKPHKTIEEIAKKHKVETSFIENQLKIGISIEKEHTTSREMASNIALQHLDEFPDYYTRLKKMEASSDKTSSSVKELEDGLKKLKNTSYDSIDRLMRRIMKRNGLTAKELHNAFKNKHNQTPDDWIKSINEGTLHHWFKGSKSKEGKPGWVQADGSPCANEPGETKTPKCFSSGRLARLKKMGKEGESIISSAIRRKREQDPNQQDKSSGASPTMVKTFAKGKKDPNYIEAEPRLKEEMEIIEAQKDKPGKSSGKKDACYYKVKSRYDVWPSAYGSASLVQCRKKGTANWGNKTEERDHEHSMIRSQLSTISNAANRIKKKMKGEGNVEAWVQSKLTKAADYIDSVADYIESGEHDVEEAISFDIGPEHNKNKKREKIRKLAKGGATEGERQAASNKLGKTPELPNVRKEEKLVDKILDETCWPGHKRKKGTKKYSQGSCVKSEDVSIEDANGNAFAEVIDIIKPEPIKGFKSQVTEASRLQAQTGNVMMITLTWRGKYYSLKMFFPQVKLPTRNEINLELQKVYPGCKVVHSSVSQLDPNQPLIQSTMNGGNLGKLGPNRNYVKPMGESVELDEDWQKVNRKDKTDGLSQKAVDAYRRENPGSNLQTAVTEKKPKGKRKKRRAAFCRRMSGMKAKLTSAKTARDPNSRINKALKRWRCG